MSPIGVDSSNNIVTPLSNHLARTILVSSTNGDWLSSYKHSQCFKSEIDIQQHSCQEIVTVI